MKQIFLSLMLAVILSSVGIFGQEFENRSEFYPKTVLINQVFVDANGYKVDYIKDDFTLGTMWLPSGWFAPDKRIGQVVYSSSSSLPYITFFIKDGKVDYFRLYVHAEKNHRSWGILDRGKNYSAEYPSVDSAPELNP